MDQDWWCQSIGLRNPHDPKFYGALKTLATLERNFKTCSLSSMIIRKPSGDEHILLYENGEANIQHEQSTMKTSKANLCQGVVICPLDYIYTFTNHQMPSSDPTPAIHHMIFQQAVSRKILCVYSQQNIQECGYFIETFSHISV